LRKGPPLGGPGSNPQCRIVLIKTLVIGFDFVKTGH